MNGAILAETLQAILPAALIETAARKHGVISRQRKLEIVKLVRSLVMSAGSEDSGRLADSYRRYCGEAEQTVVRGAFYDWLDEEMAVLMECLLEAAMEHAASLPAYLPGILGTVDDWRIFDSETITLRAALEDDYSGSGSPAAVKVHKELSVGRCCMTYCLFGPARNHDAPNFVVDERYRNMGLLLDLGYASLELIRSCHQHGAKYVIRLKDNLTNLERRTHGPHQVGELYRIRWEIESDNKLDKSGARLDQIRATTDTSVRILMCAALLHSMVVDVLIHQDKLERVTGQDVRRAPLHRLMLAYALRMHHAELLVALSSNRRGEHILWTSLAELLSIQGRDPNWRSRPSVLDRLLGLTAPRGRPRRKKLKDCHESALPYRSVKPPLRALAC